MRWTFEDHLRYAVENAAGKFSPAVVAKEMSRFVSLPMAEKLERAPELGQSWLDNAAQLATGLRAGFASSRS